MKVLNTILVGLVGLVVMAVPGVTLVVPALQLDCETCTYVDGMEESNITDIGTLVIELGDVAQTLTWAFGLAPMDANAHPLLGPHEIFPAWFAEVAFSFNSALDGFECSTYNTQTDLQYVAAGTGSHCVTVDVDMTGLLVWLKHGDSSPKTSDPFTG